MKNLTALIILAICPAMFAANASPEQNYKQAEKLQKSEKNEEAFEYYLKAARQGDAEAQFYLGLCYNYGDGVEKDLSEAVVWYRKAADQGFADAQYSLGSCYFNGYGVEKDLSEAVKWYRKAANQGFKRAQFALKFYNLDVKL